VPSILFHSGGTAEKQYVRRGVHRRSCALVRLSADRHWVCSVLIGVQALKKTFLSIPGISSPIFAAMGEHGISFGVPGTRTGMLITRRYARRPAKSLAPAKVAAASRVDGAGYSSGKNRHAPPVCRIQRMPSRQDRVVAAGRPRLSLRRLSWKNRGAMNSHCSSVTSFCLVLMAEAQPTTCLTHKFLM
jgi:hypothetical protein